MPGNPIIVGVDHSPESLCAARLAATIAQAAGVQLVPVHAVPVVPLFTGVAGIEPMPAFSPELQDELTRASQTGVVRALQDVVPPGAVRALEVQTGPAPFVLAEVARRRRAELLVLGGKAHGALARGLGRSTAHYLVRTLDVPVLVVAGSATPITRVLAAVDLSPAWRPTITAAQRLAGLFGARLRVLHVVEPLPFAHLIAAPLDEAAYERRSQEIFGRIVSPLQTVAEDDRVVRRAAGAPAEVIAEEAAAWHADVLVVGSHGKGWVDRILVGSTTQRLVTELPTSVLVVPFKATASRRSGTRPARRRVKTPREPAWRSRR